MGGGGCQNVQLNQNCRKFDEMPKSTKKFFSRPSGGRCQNVHLNQSCRKFDEMPKSPKNVFFFTVWPIGGGGWDGGGCQNVHLNQSCSKFDEMTLSTKNIFLTVWPIGRGSKCSPVIL